MFGLYELNEVNTVNEKAWLDVAITRCPNCGRHYADASWYIIEMSSDIECGNCHTNFNTKKHVSNRIMLGLKIDDEGRVEATEVAEHL